MENIVETPENFNPDKDEIPVQKNISWIIPAAGAAAALMFGFTFVNGRISGFKSEIKLLKGFGIPALKMTSAYLTTIAAGNFISKKFNISKGAGLFIISFVFDFLLIVNSKKIKKANIYMAGVTAPLIVNFVTNKIGDKIL